MTIASKIAAAANNPGAPISSANPLWGNALGVAVGVPGVEVGPVAVTVTAWVCATAACVSRAFTVCVAGSDVLVINGVFVGRGVLVRVGVEVAVRVEVAVLLA